MMAKLTAPLLGFEATGTVGDMVCFAGKNKLHIAKSIPTHLDAKTYAQLQQRWLFNDARFWWHSLSQAQKDAYKNPGRALHMSAYTYAIRYYLRNLPDIAGLWHLDEQSGATSFDSSKHANHGTIFGALSQPGLFDYSLWFDGLDDKLTCPAAPTLEITGPITLEAWIARDVAGVSHGIIDHANAAWTAGYFYGVWSTNELYTRLRYADDTFFTMKGGAIGIGWTHVVLTYDLDIGRLFVNSALVASAPATGGKLLKANPTQDVRIGTLIGGWPFSGFIDEAHIYTRDMSQAQITDHYERRLDA